MATLADVQSFVNNPPLYMKKNHVWWRGGAPADQAIINVAMIDYARTVRRRTSVLGRKVDGDGNFTLRHATVGSLQVPQGSPTFQAVWSGYAGGTAKDAHLPAVGGPNIMLTAQLTGCTVVCRPNPDGSADFSHYNLVIGGNTLQRDDMEAIAAAHYGGGHSTFTKEEMRDVGVHSPATMANVVGWRRNGAWEFWAQIVESKGVQTQIREVRRLA